MEPIRARWLTLVALAMVVCSSASPAQVQSWRKRFASSALTVGINPLNQNTIFAEGSPGLLYVSRDRGKTWNALGSPGLQLVRQIVVHPSDTTVLLCAAASPSLEKSTDGGITWHSVLANFGIDGESITYDPLHPDTMYAGNFADGNVFRSTDRGDTWVLQGKAGAQLCAFTVRPDSANILYGGTGGGQISMSTNAGVSWHVVKQGVGNRVFQEVPKIVISPVNPLVAYATLNGNPDSTLGVWKTTDGGRTWTQTALPRIATWAMAIDSANQDDFYAGTFLDGLTTVFRSTDGGSSWTSLSGGLPAGGYLWSLKDHPLDTAGVWASVTNDVFGFGGIYHLSSRQAEIGGAVLDAATGDTVKNGFVRIAATGDSVNLASSGGMYTLGYYEGDPTLTPTVEVESYPYYTGQTVITFSPGSAGHQDFTLTALPWGTVSGALADSLHHPVRAVLTLATQTVSGPVAAVETTDAAGSFTFQKRYIAYPPIVGDYALFVDPDLPFVQLKIQPLHLDTAGISLSLLTSPADVFLVGEDSADYQQYYQASLDSLGMTANAWNTVTKGPAPFPAGTKFRKKTVIYFTATKNTPIDNRGLDSLHAALGAGCNLFLTGQNIAELNDSSSFLQNDLGVGFGGNSSIVYSAGVSGDLFSGFGFYTTGAGANDQNSRDILTLLTPRARPVLGYGATAQGGTAAVRIDSAGSGGRVVYMGFGFEGINTPQTRTAVMQRVIAYLDSTFVLGVGGGKGGIPRSFALSQNYPNPFNPGTRLEFDIAREGHAVLKIYNLLGQEMGTLVDGEKQAGSYSVRWDAGGFPSGVYFAQLRVTAKDGVLLFEAARKLVVVR